MVAKTLAGEHGHLTDEFRIHKWVTFEQYAPGTTSRALAGISVTMPSPVILDGLPRLPRWRGTSESAGRAKEGPHHLHATPNPDQTGEPQPPRPPGRGPASFAVWRVADLPSPAGFHDGWYWLGARTGVDGSAGLPEACSQWPAGDGSDEAAPAWHSRYPFKPSVVSAHHWLWGGGTADHPKAVNFNSQFIEHMWLEFGQEHPQPFSWVVAAMLPTYPYGNTQFILDAGRNPFEVGLPGSYGANSCNDPRDIADNLDYRTLLTATRTQLRASVTHKRGIQARHHANVVPRMYFGVYDGDHSMVGSFTTKQRYVHHGRLPNTHAPHRFTVLGRRHGRLSQGQASHLLVFEIRYFHAAMTMDHLQALFDHLQSVYKFGRY